MSDGTAIEWTDASWTPIRARRRDGLPNKGGGGWACQRVSPGCQNCYAATINKRLGTGFDYDAKGIAASDIYLDERILTEPLHWRRPRKIFVCSMTDLFGEWVPDEMIDRVFAVMALSPQHTFQVLTKRPERMRAYLASEAREMRLPIRGSATLLRPTRNAVWLAAQAIANQRRGTVEYPWSSQWGWPLPNVWLGVSAEDQERADQRIPVLLATPAAVRFVSAEPLLGPVDFEPWLRRVATSGPGWRLSAGSALAIADVVIDWIIVGGESGPGARPCDLGWIRGIVGQCQAAGVAVFVKQLGARPCVGSVETAAGSNVFVPDLVRLKDRKGGAMDEWPEDLRVREFPEVAR